MPRCSRQVSCQSPSQATTRAALDARLSDLTAEAWETQCQSRRQALENTPMSRVSPGGATAQSTVLAQMNTLLERQNALLCQILAVLSS